MTDEARRRIEDEIRRVLMNQPECYDWRDRDIVRVVAALAPLVADAARECSECSKHTISVLIGGVERLEHEHTQYCNQCVVAAVARAVAERDEAQARYQRIIQRHSVDCISQGCARQKWEETQHEIDEEQAEEIARLRDAMDQARRETASDPDNRWARNATIILNAALRHPASAP